MRLVFFGPLKPPFNRDFDFSNATDEFSVSQYECILLFANFGALLLPKCRKNDLFSGTLRGLQQCSPLKVTFGKKIIERSCFDPYNTVQQSGGLPCKPLSSIMLFGSESSSYFIGIVSTSWICVLQFVSWGFLDRIRLVVR